MKNTKELTCEVDRKTGCWNCTSHAPSSRGYPMIGHNSKQTGAHRLVWEQVNGRSVPPGMCVCHTCDNPLCVNPAHLWLGTQADNVRDRDEKGRGNHPKGEASGGAKLTEADVRYIREHTEIGIVKMGEMMGVSYQLISRIRLVEIWKHVL